MIEIKAEDAVAHGLPPIAFAVDPRAGAMSGSSFAQPDMYLHLSGPPGGPLLFVVWRGGTPLGAAVQARYGERQLVLGESSTIELAGSVRPALAFMTGSGFSQIAWCAVHVESTAGALLVVFGVGSQRALSCAEVASHPLLAAVVRSFTLGAAPAVSIPPPAAPKAPAPAPRRPAAYAPAIGIVEDDFGPGFKLPVPKSTVQIRGWEQELAGKASVPRALGALLGLAVGSARAEDGASAFAAAIAELIVKQGLFSMGALAARYLDARRADIVVGGSTQASLDLIARGCPPERAGRLVWEKTGRDGADSGALARTGIFGALFANQPAVRRTLSFTEAAITHFEPRCQLAAAALNAAIAHALTARPSPSSMLRAAQDELREASAAMTALYADITSEIELAEAVLQSDLAAARDEDPATGNLDGNRAAFRHAFWQLLNAADVSSALDDVVARGGDAAVTGALLGAFYGAGAMPLDTVAPILHGPPVAEDTPDFHPRAFLRVLARGFASERDATTIAHLAPYVAIAFPDYAERPVVAPTSMPSLGEGWRVTQWLRGTVAAGQARCERGESRAIATFAPADRTPVEIPNDVPGVAPLVGRVAVLRDGEPLVATLEAEPEGLPLSTPTLPLRGRHALPIFAQLIAIARDAASRGVVLGGLRPEGIYVTSGATNLVVTGVLPRAERLIQGPGPGRVAHVFSSLHLPPQVTSSESSTPAVDVFSACSLFLFLTQRRSVYQAAPPPDLATAPRPLHEVVDIPGALDKNVEEAIRAGLHFDASKRPTAAEIARVLSAAGIAIEAPTFRAAR